MEKRPDFDSEPRIDKKVTYDFETDRLYLMYVSAFIPLKSDSKLKRILSKAYLYFIIIFFIFLVAMGFVASTMIQDKKLRLEAIHWTFLLLVGLSIMVIRYNKRLDEPLNMIREGFFTYTGEPPNGEYYEIKAKRVRRVRLVSNFFLGLATSSGIFLSFIKQVKDTSGNAVDTKNINTGLPIPVFLPFDTTTAEGFLCGYLIDIVAFFYLVVVTSANQQIFLSIMEQVVAQFEILNLSLSNLQERALSRLNKPTIANERNKQELYESKEYQDCIFSCLKQNIRHHLILLRFRNDIKGFNETLYLLLLLSSIIIFAAIMFVILELQEISEATILLWLLSTEIIYVFVICYYGELLSQESGRMFFVLYETPWWNFDKRNKHVLRIMMTNTFKPIIMGAPAFSSNMSLESFGDIMARAYQSMSVVRNMK